MAKYWHGQGLDLRVNVIGFTVTQDAQQQLTPVAKAGGGQYYHASDAVQLQSALDKAVKKPDTVAASQTLRNLCPNCRNEVPQTANACGYCGYRLKTPAPAPQPKPVYVAPSTPPPSTQPALKSSAWWRAGAVVLAAIWMSVREVIWLVSGSGVSTICLDVPVLILLGFATISYWRNERLIKAPEASATLRRLTLLGVIRVSLSVNAYMQSEKEN